MNTVCSCSFKVCSDWLSWSSEKGHDEGFGQAYRRFSRLLADAAQVRADAKEIPDLKAAEDGVGNRRKRQVGFCKARSRILIANVSFSVQQAVQEPNFFRGKVQLILNNRQDNLLSEKAENVANFHCISGRKERIH